MHITSFFCTNFYIKYFVSFFICFVLFCEPFQVHRCANPIRYRNLLQPQKCIDLYTKFVHMCKLEDVQSSRVTNLRVNKHCYLHLHSALLFFCNIILIRKDQNRIIAWQQKMVAFHFYNDMLQYEMLL